MHWQYHFILPSGISSESSLKGLFSLIFFRLHCSDTIKTATREERGYFVGHTIARCRNGSQFVFGLDDSDARLEHERIAQPKTGGWIFHLEDRCQVFGTPIAVRRLIDGPFLCPYASGHIGRIIFNCLPSLLVSFSSEKLTRAKPKCTVARLRSLVCR